MAETNTQIQPIELLQKAFPALKPSELEQLTLLSRIVTYPPNTILCHEGVYETTFYLVSKGEAKVTKKLNDKEDLLLRGVDPGDFFGEMAIIQDAPRSATVTTVRETTVIEIDKEIFERVLQQNAQMAMVLVRTTLDRMRINDMNTINDLRRAYETLEKLDRAKLDFIEVTAHELRTPLTVMRGYASILLMEPNIQGNSTLQEITQGIVNGTSRLHEIVNNMLDVQRIDLKKIKAAAVPVSLPVVLRGIEMEFKEAIQDRNLHFTMTWSKVGDMQYIEADPGLISKALHHIIMNAVKYTPDDGSITVAFTYVDDPEMGQAVHIVVADTGIGIDKEHQELIFEKFYRLGDVSLHSSGHTAFKAGGPGLGLAIARGAVIAHGGRIWVESQGEDERNLPGSIFHIMLPVKSRGMFPATETSRPSTRV